MAFPSADLFPAVGDDYVACKHRKLVDLPYCTTIPCRNYVARTDTWKQFNGWRYIGKVES